MNHIPKEKGYKPGYYGKKTIQKATWLTSDYARQLVKRVTTLANCEPTINILDKEQPQFFKTVYQKNDAALDEFDLVINRDHISGVSQTAKK
jgi:hypothetical protein